MYLDHFQERILIIMDFYSVEFNYYSFNLILNKFNINYSGNLNFFDINSKGTNSGPYY